MVLSKNKILLILLIPFFLYGLDYDKIPMDKVAHYLEKQLKKSEKALVNKSKECRNQKKIKIDLNISVFKSKEEAEIALKHLAYRNMQLCDLNETKDYIYNLSRIINFKSSHNMDSKKELDIISFVNSSGDDVSSYLEMIYKNRVSKSTREYLEKIIGTKQFDLKYIGNQIEKKFRKKVPGDNNEQEGSNDNNNINK